MITVKTQQLENGEGQRWVIDVPTEDINQLELSPMDKGLMAYKHSPTDPPELNALLFLQGLYILVQKLEQHAYAIWIKKSRRQF